MNKRRERMLKKKKLVERINVQRVSLSQCTEQFLTRTEKFDRGWEALFRMRALIVLGTSVVLVKALRKKPSRIYFWPRRFLGIWAASRFFRSKLSIR